MWSSKSNGNYDVNCFFFLCLGGGDCGLRVCNLMSCLQVVFKFGRLVFFKMIFLKCICHFVSHVTNYLMLNALF